MNNDWPRANPKELAAFDPSTKRCEFNCGPHSDDPRTAKERKFLCTDCQILPPEPAFPRYKYSEANLLLAVEALEFTAGDWDPERVIRHLQEQINLAKNHVIKALKIDPAPQDLKELLDQLKQWEQDHA